MSELQNVFKINTIIKKRKIFLQSENKPENETEISNLKFFKNEINRTMQKKVNLLSALVVQKIELFCEEKIRKKLIQSSIDQTQQPPSEDKQKNLKKPELFLSFIKE